MDWIVDFFSKGIVQPLLNPLFGDRVNVLFYILCAVTAVSSYLIGSLNFAIIISIKSFHEDIRAYGSKNAGATNMMRTYGGRAAALTFLGDGLKAVVSCLIGYACLGYLGAYIAGLFCVIGHMFPIYFRFRGGKGVVTAALSILMCSPLVFLLILIIFAIIAVGTRYVSLASIMSALFYPILLFKIPVEWTGGAGTAYPLFALLIMLLVVFKHRDNISRLLRGEERKFTVKKKKKPSQDTAAEDTSPSSQNNTTEEK